MFQGIETHSAEAVSGIVAQEMSDEAVCRFMQRYGNEDWEHPRRCHIEHHAQLHIVIAVLPSPLVMTEPLEMFSRQPTPEENTNVHRHE